MGDLGRWWRAKPVEQRWDWRDLDQFSSTSWAVFEMALKGDTVGGVERAKRVGGSPFDIGFVIIGHLEDLLFFELRTQDAKGVMEPRLDRAVGDGKVGGDFLGREPVPVCGHQDRSVVF